MPQQGMRTGSLYTLCLLAASLAAEARGESAATARSENFIVLGPSPAVAERVAERAEHYRREIALAWFGGELPTVEKHNIIFVRVNEAESIGRSQLSGDEKANLTWLTASLEEVTSTLLAHEVAHTVMAGRFGDQMPAWANEGIASIYDDPERHAIRKRIQRDFVVERHYPDLMEVIEGAIRSQHRYTAATSLTQFLLERGSRSQFFDFVEAGDTHGWDHALGVYYGIASLSDLQREWQRWLQVRVVSR